VFSISSTLFAKSPLRSFSFVVIDKRDLNVNISPKTLAVSARVNGVEELK